MPPQLNSTHYEVPSYQFITDPKYDETLSGRVRAACITCSRRKIKCSGGVPCETCLSHKRKCEGLKKATRWAKSRKLVKKRTSSFDSMPSNVYGFFAGDKAVNDSKHDRKTQSLVNARAQRDQNMNSFPGLGELLTDLSTSSSDYDGQRLLQPLTMSEQPVSAIEGLMAGTASPSSWPNSPPTEYSTSALRMIESSSEDQGLCSLVQFDMSLYPVPDAPTDTGNAASFILAAECLEHQARILRMRALGQRHNSIDNGHLSSQHHPLAASEIQYSLNEEALGNTTVTDPSLDAYKWNKPGSINVVTSEVEGEQAWATYDL